REGSERSATQGTDGPGGRGHRVLPQFLAGAVDLQHLARLRARHERDAARQSMHRGRAAYLRLPEHLACWPVLDDLVLGEMRYQHTAVWQHVEAGAKYLAGAGRKAVHLLAVRVEEDAVASVGEKDDLAIREPAGCGDVAHGAGVSEDLLAIPGQLQHTIGMDDEGVAAGQAMSGEDGPAQFLAPLDLAVEVALGDALALILGDQDALASNLLGVKRIFEALYLPD